MAKIDARLCRLDRPGDLGKMRRVQGRIRFPGNPWPQGHALAALSLSAALDARHGVGLLLHLKTQDYAADGPGIDDGGDADWTSPDVWENFGDCTLSNTAWGYLNDQLVRLDHPPFRRFDPRDLVDQAFDLDPVADLSPGWSPGDRPFQIYLLGHDAVAEHRISFAEGSSPGLFDIRWSGRIALFYAGEEDFRHRFEAEIHDAPFEGFELDADLDVPVSRRQAAAQALLERFVTRPGAWRFVPGQARGDKDRFVPAL